MQYAFLLFPENNNGCVIEFQKSSYIRAQNFDQSRIEFLYKMMLSLFWTHFWKFIAQPSFVPNLMYHKV